MGWQWGLGLLQWPVRLLWALMAAGDEGTQAGGVNDTSIISNLGLSIVFRFVSAFEVQTRLGSSHEPQANRPASHDRLRCRQRKPGHHCAPQWQAKPSRASDLGNHWSDCLHEHRCFGLWSALGTPAEVSSRRRRNGSLRHCGACFSHLDLVTQCQQERMDAAHGSLHPCYCHSASLSAVTCSACTAVLVHPRARVRHHLWACTLAHWHRA